MTVPSKKLQIDQIMDNFEFIDVVDALNILKDAGWLKGKFKVLTVPEMMEIALEMLSSVEEDCAVYKSSLLVSDSAGSLSLIFAPMYVSFNWLMEEVDDRS